MLSRTSKYALQALALMAAAPDEWHDGKFLASRLGIPANYLSKVLGQLARIGLLESRKGWGGGFRFRREPSALTLEEVVLPLEGWEHGQSCVFGFPVCSDERPCPLHEEWKRIVALYRDMLSRSTVADLVANEAIQELIADKGVKNGQEE